MKKGLLLIISILLFYFSHAEGTRQLRPTAADKGNLHLNDDAIISGTSINMYTNFGMYNASESEKIKIRISSTDEIIFFGLNNKQPNGGNAFIPNVPYRIKDPLGNVVYDRPAMPELGEEGFIETWDMAAAGPLELGDPNGYDAIRIDPLMVGDYVIEFNPDDAMDIHLFDITVASAALVAIPGRLHSQGWQISTENGSNPFVGHVFPYDPRGVVYDVDFNGMQPFTFGVNFNSSGAGQTGIYLDDRKSKKGKLNYSVPEFEVFLNLPDNAEFPTFNQTGNFSGIVEKGSCEDKSYCLKYTSDVAGVLEGYIDVNNNATYDANLDVLFDYEFPKDTSICIPWDGKDFNGNAVSFEKINVIASFGLSVTHLPIFDAEHNVDGLKVKIASPLGFSDPLLYWDDSGINDTKNLDEKVNSTGCNSQTTGCHKWKDRGNNNNPETINTWWYTKVLFDTLLVEIFYDPPVELSFSPTELTGKDSSICKGDSLSFFVYNNGGHFDNSKFTYTWELNGALVSPANREYKDKISANSQLVILSVSNADPTCVSHDTLTVSVQNSVEISASVTDEDCLGNPGSINVTMLDGSSNAQFYWMDFPSIKTNSINNLNAGNYHLIVADSAYSSNCAVDTVFTIANGADLRIDTIEIGNSECYTNSGFARVLMEDYLYNYTYTWSGSAVTDSVVHDLSAGLQHLTITEPQSGCQLDTNFTIAALPFDITATTQNELCSDGTGSIQLSIPSTVLSVYWNGTLENITNKNLLSAGMYDLKVVSPLDPTCFADTLVEIQNEIHDLKISNLEIKDFECFYEPGSGKVTMLDPLLNYEYSWNNSAFSGINTYSNLSAGTYPLTIREVGTNCTTDTVFQIQDSDVKIVATVSPDLCNSSGGGVSLSFSAPNVQVTWANGSTESTLSDLTAGSYQVFINRTSHPLCALDTSFYVQSISYDVVTDLSFEVDNYNNVPETDAIIEFKNLSQGNIAESHWDFGDGNLSDQFDTEHIYTQEGEYMVTLQVTDEFGCTGNANTQIVITKLLPCEIAMANAFSPNNDLQNETIGILGYAPKVDLKIFNRWGEVIFRSFDLENKWDGSYLNKDVPLGVYPYVLDYECSDEGGKMVKKQLIGEINLIR